MVDHELNQAHDRAENCLEFELSDALEQEVPRMRGAALAEEPGQAQVNEAKGPLAHARAVQRDHEHIHIAAHLFNGLDDAREQELRVSGFARRVGRLREEIADGRVKDRV